MVEQKRLGTCKDHDIKNRFSRFTIPHGIVGPHLKRPSGGFLVLLKSDTVIL